MYLIYLDNKKKAYCRTLNIGYFFYIHVVFKIILCYTIKVNYKIKILGGNKMVIVTAKSFFKEGKLKEAEGLLRELIEKTNLEDGCIEYRAYKRDQTTDEIVIIEKWESKKHLDAHMKTKHFTEILPKLSEMCDKEMEVAIYNELF